MHIECICLYMYVVYVDRLPPMLIFNWSPEKLLIWGGGGGW